MMSAPDDVEMTRQKSKCHHPVDSGDVCDPLVPHLCRTDLNKVIMNYLVNEGYKEASRQFGLETGLQVHLPLDSLDNRTKVRDSIEKGQIEETIVLLNAMYPGMLGKFVDLHFELLKQHLVELIRGGEVEMALIFAQSQLAEHGLRSTEARCELERVMSLLLFEDPYSSPYGDLLLESQRLKLASRVNAAILTLDNHESKNNLVDFYKLLLWTQNEMDQKKVKYDRMTDLGSGSFESTSTMLMDTEKL